MYMIADMNPHINIEKLSFAYIKQNIVLKDLSFSISRLKQNQNGYVSVIMGESGTGKSTLLKLILGTEIPTMGTITIEPSSARIAYVPQEPVLFEHLTALQNARYFEFAGNVRNKFDEQLFSLVADALGLHEVLKSKSILNLSGGQRQRLSLLRALSISPDFLLLDEPCTGLDAEVKKQFLTILREITAKINLSVIYITHHQEEATMIADEIIYLLKDQHTGCVNSVVQGDVSSFLYQTPNLEAAKVFFFPELNIVPVCQNSGKLKFNDAALNTDCYLACRSANFTFRNDNGKAFEFVSSTPVFSRFKSGNIYMDILIESKVIQNHNFFSINGECWLYDHKGIFLRNITLKNNEIIDYV